MPFCFATHCTRANGFYLNSSPATYFYPEGAVVFHSPIAVYLQGQFTQKHNKTYFSPRSYPSKANFQTSI